jgi:exonuclease VII small subunit
LQRYSSALLIQHSTLQPFHQSVMEMEKEAKQLEGLGKVLEEGGEALKEAGQALNAADKVLKMAEEARNPARHWQTEEDPPANTTAETRSLSIRTSREANQDTIEFNKHEIIDLIEMIIRICMNGTLERAERATERYAGLEKSILYYRFIFLKMETCVRSLEYVDTAKRERVLEKLKELERSRTTERASLHEWIGKMAGFDLADSAVPW